MEQWNRFRAFMVSRFDNSAVYSRQEYWKSIGAFFAVLWLVLIPITIIGTLLENGGVLAGLLIVPIIVFTVAYLYFVYSARLRDIRWNPKLSVLFIALLVPSRGVAFVGLLAMGALGAIPSNTGSYTEQKTGQS